MSRRLKLSEPTYLENEQSLLGAAMMSHEGAELAFTKVHSLDFQHHGHVLIYLAIADLFARREPADAVTVSAHLTRSGLLEEAGGAPYLHTLISMAPMSTAYAVEYADRLSSWRELPSDDQATNRKRLIALNGLRKNRELVEARACRIEQPSSEQPLGSWLVILRDDREFKVDGISDWHLVPNGQAYEFLGSSGGRIAHFAARDVVAVIGQAAERVPSKPTWSEFD